jgi:hypothetical protein
MVRMVEQIASARIGDADAALVVLANDGTLWRLVMPATGTPGTDDWLQLPHLPQGDVAAFLTEPPETVRKSEAPD